MNASELKLFPSREFGTIHVALLKGQPWFLANEIGNVLQISAPRKVIAKAIPVSDTLREPIYNGGVGNPNKLLVNASAVKTLALKSPAKLSSSFVSYIENEILPEIGIDKPTSNSKLAELGCKPGETYHPNLPAKKPIASFVAEENPLKIRSFTNSEFGTVRTTVIHNEPWFVGKDVAERLGYANPNKAIGDHVDVEDKFHSKTLSSFPEFSKLNNETLSSFSESNHGKLSDFGQRGNWMINESGLYSLILSSKLDSAKRFKRWITSEVLPAIRSTGGYIAGEKNMSDEDLISQALLLVNRKLEMRNQEYAQLEKRHEALTAEAEVLRPKASFADAVQASDSSIPIGDLAKILKQNGVDIGRNRMMQWLRDHNYLISAKGSSFNCPTQFAMERELFELHEYEVCRHYNHSQIGCTTYVTGKGQTFFVKKFLGLQDQL